MEMEQVKVAETTYEIVDSGKGSDASVVFLNGFRMPLSSWRNVYEGLRGSFRCLLYNRRGIGKSSKANSVQDGTNVLQDLNCLLTVTDFAPPYYLVAHSLGGLFANLFTRLYPERVSGVVFVEATHPHEIEEQKAIAVPKTLGIINNGVKEIEKLFDPYKFSEDECAEQTVIQTERAPSFPEIPIAVISGTTKMPLVPERAHKIHQYWQRQLLYLTSDSIHYQCEKSGHFPQITEPDIVTTVIKNMVL